ncbi:MAG TPA: hypothetical protein VIJ85_02725 [Rhizomicrobium sp.]
MNYSTGFNADETFVQDNDGLPGDEENPIGDMPNVPRELKNRMHLLEDQVSELYDIVADDAARSADIVEQVIVDRPWISVAIAFGLGCAAAALLRPSRR